MNGQILGTLGTLGAAYMMCWAARAAFGERDPRWLVARRWMLRRAPHWLRRLYVRHGMRLAAAIDGSPALRAEYRALFRRLVAGDTAARHELGASLLALAA